MKVVFLLILFIKTKKTTCKVFRNLLRCKDFRQLDYTKFELNGPGNPEGHPQGSLIL